MLKLVSQMKPIFALRLLTPGSNISSRAKSTDSNFNIQLFKLAGLPHALMFGIEEEIPEKQDNVDITVIVQALLSTSALYNCPILGDF